MRKITVHEKDFGKREGLPRTIPTNFNLVCSRCNETLAQQAADAEIQVNRRLCEALREALRKVMDATPHSMRQDAEAWADAERVLAETEAV